MPHLFQLFRLTVIGAGFVAMAASASHALAAQRTFVHSSPLGNDANTVSSCSLVAPCRSFNSAISVTDPGGELVILDTAGYGPMTIGKSIKIIGPSGVYGGISVLGGGGPTTGVVINAGATDVITLRGLDISGVPGAVGPFPNIGIDIQNAGEVHLEKSSIGNFTQASSACINVAPTSESFVHITDSFLRECRTGINANGTALPAAVDAAVIVDNTRIERGRAASGLVYGLRVQGKIGMSVRNSLISVEDVGIQVDNLTPNGTTVLELSQTKLVGMGTGLNVVSASAGGVPFVYITGSEFVGIDDGIIFSHSAAGTTVGGQLKVADSYFAQLSNSGITASTGSDAAINIDLVRSQLSAVGHTAISMDASGTSAVKLSMRDTTLSNATTLLKTSGTSSVNATLIRTHLHNSVTAVDHGRGRIRMEQTNVTANVNSLVNSGSGNIVSAGIGSAGTNWIIDNIDSTGGTVYITPTIIPMK